jgi:hypothetical protein
MYVRAEDADALARTKRTQQVRFLGGFDQWVLGPGTDDGHVTPRARRSAVSKQSGWISPVVVQGGIVAGTWELNRDHIAVMWFNEAGKTPPRALWAESDRLAEIVGRELTMKVTVG